MTAVNTGRLHHALMFHGPSGAGKAGHAIELAAALNCTNPSSSASCGLCVSCRKTRSFQHGNIKTVIPFPRKTGMDKNSPSIKALSDADLASLQEQLNTMGKDPYFKIALNNANTILINSIRDLKSELYLSPPDDSARIVLILDAEYLCIPNPTSANALLKILEEPPEKTYFILITSRADLMLETISSRCQKIYFPAISENDIESFLIEQGESPPDAHLIARMSEGNMHLTRNFQGTVYQLYENVKTFLNAVFTLNPDLWVKLQKEIIQLKKSNRIQMEYLFRTGIFAFRDLLLLSETEDSENVVFSDNIEKYLKVLEKLPQANWAECIHILEDALSYIRANGYLPLVINTMLMDLRRATRGREVKRYSIQD